MWKSGSDPLWGTLHLSTKKYSDDGVAISLGLTLEQLHLPQAEEQNPAKMLWKLIFPNLQDFFKKSAYGMYIIYMSYISNPFCRISFVSIVL